VTDSERRGLIVARHRREVIVEDTAGESWQGLLRGRRIRALTGDEVLFGIEADGTAVIESLLPRRTVLERIDNRGQAEGIAANVSLLAIVGATEPAPDWQLVDRYLVAAALMEIDAILVINKCDLGDGDLDEAAQTYSELGYRVCRTSTIDGRGLGDLATLLRPHRSVLLGQSGVGKSSLLNTLLANEVQAVQSLSRRRTLGRHTTTAAVLHRLPGGGDLIDSPGVRRYAPVITEPAALARGFIEFRPYLDRCRFNDCRHAGDAGCAVQAAVARGEIAARRYQSYTALWTAFEQLR
jgi:ribosome biogenesis GTPase